MPNQQYLDFESALKNKFLELRPTFTPAGNETLEQLTLDPTFKKLFIIDRAMINRSIFEAGYLLWEECNRDVEKFLALFDVKVKNGKLELDPIESDTPQS